jgi:acetyl-CoA carboxylase carboxyl transferase subunit beta
MVLDRLRWGGGRRDPKKIPDGLWVKCPSCQKTVFKRLVEERLETCPECGHHFPMTAHRRIETLVDAGTWQEWDVGITSIDPLVFTDSQAYPKRIEGAIKKTGLKEAVVCGRGSILGHPCGLGVMDFRFNGGSMGSAVGEKLTRLVERCTDGQIPVVIVSASGGARMQEGILSLMQMAKVNGALSRHSRAQLPFISVLTRPTFGGVTASFATVGDVNIAEPKALIGFAGPGVIKTTIKQELPEGFQTSEFCLDHGQIDLIVERQDLQAELGRILGYLTPLAS